MQGDELAALRAALAPMRLAYLFGSAARGEDQPGSDVDVAVLADEELSLNQLALLSETLAGALGAARRVDVADLRAASPVLCAEVVRDGVVLAERDPLDRFDFEMDAIRRFEDTRQLRRVQHELLREAARGPT